MIVQVNVVLKKIKKVKFTLRNLSTCIVYIWKRVACSWLQSTVFDNLLN